MTINILIEQDLEKFELESAKRKVVEDIMSSEEKVDENVDEPEKAGDTERAGGDTKKAEDDTKKAEDDTKKAEGDTKKAEDDTTKAKGDPTNEEGNPKTRKGIPGRLAMPQYIGLTYISYHMGMPPEQEENDDSGIDENWF